MSRPIIWDELAFNVDLTLDAILNTLTIDAAKKICSLYRKGKIKLRCKPDEEMENNDGETSVLVVAKEKEYEIHMKKSVLGIKFGCYRLAILSHEIREGLKKEGN